MYVESRGGVVDGWNCMWSRTITNVSAVLTNYNRQERGVGYQDLLEKAEFMRRLAESRVKGITKPPPAAEEEEALAAAAAASAGPTAGEAAASTASTSSSASSGPSASASASAGGAGEKKEAAAAKAVDEAARYEKALEEIMKMRVSEIKQELDLLKVSHKGLFEKCEFAEVLAKARLAPGACVYIYIYIYILYILYIVTNNRSLGRARDCRRSTADLRLISPNNPSTPRLVSQRTAAATWTRTRTPANIAP